MIVSDRRTDDEETYTLEGARFNVDEIDKEVILTTLDGFDVVFSTDELEKLQEITEALEKLSNGP